MQYSNFESIFLSKTFVVLSILNWGFVLAAPIYVIKRGGFIKPHKTDPKYMNYCYYAGIVRMVIWCASIYGLRDHIATLALNLLGILIICFFEKDNKRISNEYFKY